MFFLFALFNNHITGDDMYLAKKAKKKKFFQPSYEIEDNMIYITNTSRAKKRFLKSDIKDVYFGQEFENDSVIGNYIKIVDEYDYDFLCEYLDSMITYVAQFFKLTLPLGSIAVFSADEKVIAICSKYAKMISVVGVCRESEVRGGITIRYVKKLKTLPDMVVTQNGESLSPVFKVPRINLCENGEKSPLTLTRNTISFKTDLFPFDISMGTLVHFVKKGENVKYELSSYRKKCPVLFTFY